MLSLRSNIKDIVESEDVAESEIESMKEIVESEFRQSIRSGPRWTL